MNAILVQRIRAVLFDLDGTLADTSGEICEALGLAFAELGLAPLRLEQVERLIGRGIASMVERALQQAGGGADVAQAIERFQVHYAKTVATSAQLFPSTLDGIGRLHAHGFAMAVVTNKSRHFSERLLDRLQLRALVPLLVAGDDGFAKKPAGDMLLSACEQLGQLPRETLMIGDSANDVAAARAAGCLAWCVPFGYNEGRAVATLACDRLVESIDEAARLLTDQP